MADINKLARLEGGAVKNVALDANTPVVLSIKIGGSVSNTELTKTILDKLVSVQAAADADGTFDTRYTKSTDLASTTNGKGASLVGIEDSAGNFTATTVEDALSELYSQLGSGAAAADVTYSNATSGLTASNVQTAIDEVEGRVDSVETLAAAAIPSSEKGQANGVATLDGGGKVPVSQLPNAVMTYEGVWNASTNSPTLADGSGNAGQVYRVGTAGSQDLGSGSISFQIGDYVIYNGSVWEKSDTTDAVASVNGLNGIVVLDTDDIAEGSTNKYYSATQARTDLIASSISDGDTTHAPSGEAVFEALALKQAASANLDEADTFFGATDITGAEAEQLTDGSNADALHAHEVTKKVMAAGESFAANTTFAVRLARNGETAKRAYKADKDNSTADLFYVIGLKKPGSAASAGNNIDVVTHGTVVLGASDTPFNSTDIGKPVFLDASGAMTLTAPSATGEAVVRIGIIEDTDRLFVQPQLVGIN